MRLRAQKKQPPVLQRYESKFVIPEYMVESISDFASVYCSLDKYSEKAEDNFYRVNNLYFDTPNYLFLMRRIDLAENRFNMRVRTYSDASATPCYFEIKQKNINIIKKYRAAVYDHNWHHVFDVPGYVLHKQKGQKATANANLFVHMAYAYNATPKVLSQYLRKAYVSDINDYGRVTFDRDLRYQPAEGYSLMPDEHKMVPLDHEGIFDPGSFSKYVTGVVNILNDCRYDSALRQAAAEYMQAQYS